ncbi:hypothetical protein SELMODRAFT_407534 [Selaginella moellendorffii]|uniref:Uncharacterized protein n=1 Tax=Selaginella moellendorffii TaxID=88036 RepID=D8R5X7_SELML|nr:hypothetical protein SELMODRAFT_407534 [Selaginella moellendorffii]
MVLVLVGSPLLLQASGTYLQSLPLPTTPATPVWITTPVNGYAELVAELDEQDETFPMDAGSFNDDYSGVAGLAPATVQHEDDFELLHPQIAGLVEDNHELQVPADVTISVGYELLHADLLPQHCHEQNTYEPESAAALQQVDTWETIIQGELEMLVPSQSFIPPEVWSCYSFLICLNMPTEPSGICECWSGATAPVPNVFGRLSDPIIVNLACLPQKDERKSLQGSNHTRWSCYFVPEASEECMARALRLASQKLAQDVGSIKEFSGNHWNGGALESNWTYKLMAHDNANLDAAASVEHSCETGVLWKRFPQVRNVWLSTEMQNFVDESKEYKGWNFYYSDIPRQVGTIRMA